MNLKKIWNQNRPTILTAIGVGGLIGTAFMAYRSAGSVQMAMDEAFNRRFAEDPGLDDLPKKEKAKIYAKTLWPTVTLGAISTVLVFLGNKDHLSRRSAALAAYYISESTLKDYQAEMVKELGEKKEKEVRDRVAERRMNQIPVNESTVMISENDKPWVCDTATGCFFRMGYEKLRRIIAEANLEMLKRDYISVVDLYEMFGVQLPPGDQWYHIGWNARSGDIEPYFTSAVREIMGETVPCMVMEYRVKPYDDYDIYERG